MSEIETRLRRRLCARQRWFMARTLKWFAEGAGCLISYSASDILLVNWNGRDDGSARYIPHVRRYSRNGNEYASLAALLRGIESEHQLEVKGWSRKPAIKS